MSATEYERVPAPSTAQDLEQINEPVEVAPVPIPEPQPGSLQAQVRAARERTLAKATVDLEIPGTEGTLWGTFRAVDDFRERYRIEMAYQRMRNEASQALEVAAEMLRVACVDCFVPQAGFVPDEDHDKFSLEMTLGKQLAEWLGVYEPRPGQVVSDHEAIFLIFPSTVSISNTATKLGQFSAGMSSAADEELAGNSQAPIS